MRVFARNLLYYSRILGLTAALLVVCGCVLNEGTRAILPTSSEAQLRRDISRQLEDSGFPTASQAGAPQATP